MRHVADCAISLGFLLSFARDVPDGLSTSDVVQQIIVPSTVEQRCRYVALPSVPANAVGRSQFFISHGWAVDFTRELVALVVRHFADITDAAASASQQDPTGFSSLSLAQNKPDSTASATSVRPTESVSFPNKQEEPPHPNRPSTDWRPSPAAASASGVYAVLLSPAAVVRPPDSAPPLGATTQRGGNPPQLLDLCDVVPDSRAGSQHAASWRASAPAFPLPLRPPTATATGTTTTATAITTLYPGQQHVGNTRTLSRLRAGRDGHSASSFGVGVGVGVGSSTALDGRPSWTDSGSGAMGDLSSLPGAPAAAAVTCHDTSTVIDEELSLSSSFNPLLTRPSYQEDSLLQHPQQHLQPPFGSRKWTSQASLSAGGGSLSRVIAAAAALGVVGSTSSGSGNRRLVPEVELERAARGGGECRTLGVSRSASMAATVLPGGLGTVCTTRTGCRSGRSSGHGMLGEAGLFDSGGGGGGGRSFWGHIGAHSLRERLSRAAASPGADVGGSAGPSTAARVAASATASGSSDASDAAVAEVVASTASSSSMRSRSSRPGRGPVLAVDGGGDFGLVRGGGSSGFGAVEDDGTSCTTNAELVDRLRARFVGREALLDETFVWLDIFAINQHLSSAQADDLSKLQDVVGASDATLLVLDRSGLVLTRIWCLYEIWQTVRKKGPKALQVLGAALEHTRLLLVWGQLDVERAQATVDTDRVTILADIRATTGTEELNRHIKRALLESAKLDLEHARSISPRGPLHGEAAYRAAALARVSGGLTTALAAAREAADVFCGCCGSAHASSLRSLRAVAGCHKDLGALSHALGLLQQQVLPYLETACWGPGDAIPDYGVLSDVGALHHALGQYDTAYDYMLMALVHHLRRLHRAAPYATSQLAPLVTGAYVIHPSDAVRLPPLSDERLAVVLAALDAFVEEAVARCRSTAVQAAPLPPPAPTSVAMSGCGGGTGAGRLGQEVDLIGEAVGLVLHSLAVVQKDRAQRQRCPDSSGQLREAREMMEVAVRLLEVFSGASRGMSASDARANLAGLVLDGGDYQTAERLLRANLALTESVYGRDHPHTATALNNLAMCLKRQKSVSPSKAAEAEALYRRCLAVAGASLGEAHPETLVVAINLGVLLADQGHLTESEDLLCRAVASLSSWQLSSYHPDVLAAHKRLAEVLELRSKFFEAEAMYRITLQYAEGAPAECRDHGVVLECREGLARVQELLEGAAREQVGAACCLVS